MKNGQYVRTEAWKQRMREIAKKRFASGWKHPMLGKKRSEEYKRLNCQKQKNPMWKGDDVGYKCLHKFLRRHYPAPKRCLNCGWIKPRLELANITGEYRRDMNHFAYICCKCHRIKDNFPKKFRERKAFQKRWREYNARFGI